MMDEKTNKEEQFNQDENEKTESIIVEEKKYKFAGFWMRFWAYLLDLVIVASINGIIVTPLVAVTNIREINFTFMTLEALLIAMITFLYFVLLTKKWGQTIGKRVFGLKVINKKEGALTWSSVVFREVIGRYILQAFTITYTLYLIVAFQKEKQGLHDMVGETYVIHEEI
ncbi:RDD family protein [Anaerobacillus arseniciselenatis]|nr:RDD family protein [Anaerobacillus arseniciselenatis]